MSFMMQEEPAHGRDRAHDEICARLHPSRRMASLDGKLRTGTPLPVYRLGRPRGDITTRPEERAKKVGWRYPIFGGKVPGLLFLHRAGGKLVYGGISEGEFPNRLLKAALAAEKEIGGMKKALEPRLLEIPSLRLYMLWFYASRGKNYFFPLTGRRDPKHAYETNIRGMIARSLSSMAPKPAVRPRRRKR